MSICSFCLYKDIKTVMQVLIGVNEVIFDRTVKLRKIELGNTI